MLKVNWKVLTAEFVVIMNELLKILEVGVLENLLYRGLLPEVQALALSHTFDRNW